MCMHPYEYHKIVCVFNIFLDLDGVYGAVCS